VDIFWGLWLNILKRLLRSRHGSCSGSDGARDDRTLAMQVLAQSGAIHQANSKLRSRARSGWERSGSGP
jgi:hypothetical protein